MQNLSPDGAVGRATRGHNWVDGDFQRADITDALNRLFNLTVWAHAEERYKDPKPVFRPGVADPEDERKQKVADTVVAYMEHYRAQREA